MKYHPDRGGDAWAFEQVNWAYQEALRYLANNRGQAFPPPPVASPSPAPGRPTQFYDHQTTSHGTGGTPPPQQTARPARSKEQKVTRREWVSASFGTGFLIVGWIVYWIYKTFFMRDPLDKFRIKPK